ARRVRVPVRPPPVRPGQLPERLAVPGPRPGEQNGCPHPAHLPSAPPGTPAPYIHHPQGELGGSRAPSFPAPRCIHHRPPRTIPAPDRAAAAGTTPERDDPDASPPDQPAHRRTPGRPDRQRPAPAPGPAGPRRPPGPPPPARPPRPHSPRPAPPPPA